MILNFSDRSVTYETFLGDLSARLAKLIREDELDPEYISQRTAYKMFGRRNVDRWRRNRLVNPCKRVGRLEYRTSELRLLQRTQQDYFSE